MIEQQPLTETASARFALRGVWGYHGDHRPHGDRLLALRRHVPIVVEVIDTPEACERWLEVMAELTAATGLDTAEALPALRVSGPGGHLEGGLRLAQRRG
jgi:PII-like signaling protein